jgi:hypothetical protein
MFGYVYMSVTQGEKRNIYKIRVEKSKGRDKFGDRGVGERILTKGILKDQGVRNAHWIQWAEGKVH